MHRPAELQSRLEISPSTLRHWSNTFTDFLSPSARPSTTENGGPAQRRFTDADLRVLATVKQLLAAGLTYDRIKEQLNEPTLELEAPREPAAIAVVNPQRELPEALTALATLSDTQQQALTVLRELVAVQERQNALLRQQQAATEALVVEMKQERETWKAELEALRGAIPPAREPWYKRLFAL